jgi:hypothetical protein
VLGVVVVATAVGALAAHNVYQRPAPADAATRIPVSTGSPSVAPTTEPGSPRVSVTPDVLHDPLHGEVQQVLQTYFNAINNRRYEQWRSVVTASMAAKKSQQDFLTGYATTKDGSILVYRVDRDLGQNLRVLVSFHSTQSVADAPSDHPSGCLKWQVVWPLTFSTQDNAWQLDTGTSAGSPQVQDC